MPSASITGHAKMIRALQTVHGPVLLSWECHRLLVPGCHYALAPAPEAQRDELVSSQSECGKAVSCLVCWRWTASSSSDHRQNHSV